MNDSLTHLLYIYFAIWLEAYYYFIFWRKYVINELICLIIGMFYITVTIKNITS